MTTDTVGGVWTWTCELAAALAPYHVRIFLATRGAPLSFDRRRAVSRLPNVELFESALRLEWMADPWADVERASAWLLELESLVEPDVVHLNDFAHGALPFRAPTVVVGHSCVCSWFAAVRRTPPPPSFDRYCHAVREGIAGADVVAAPSRAMLAALARHHGPLPPARVIEGGSSVPERADEKEDFVLAAGRLWDEAKNLAALDRIAGRIAWPIFAAGDTRQPHAAPPPAGVGERASGSRPLGFLSRDELDLWMARAAIFAHPARYEPFGLVVLEAARAGCALVLGDIESLRELWDGAAAFVEPDDPEALAATLEGLIRHPGLRRLLGENARVRSRAYGAERMGRAWLSLYRSLLAPDFDLRSRSPSRSRRAANDEASPCA